MKTPKRLLQKLKRYIKENGKAKTAVALNLKDTNAISNWLARDEIPERYHHTMRHLERVVVSGKIPSVCND